jgi:uncharacterized protein (DUF2062 family)
MFTPELFLSENQKAASMFKLQRTARYYFLRLRRLRGNPKALARGAALGVFIGITPTIPLHTVAIVALSFPLRASKISGLLASIIISNPLTIPFAYYFSWLIGDRLLPGVLTWDKFDSLMESISSGAGFMVTIDQMGSLGFDALSVLLLGGFILALPFTVASYFLSLNFFRIVEEKGKKRRITRKNNGQPD